MYISTTHLYTYVVGTRRRVAGVGVLEIDPPRRPGSLSSQQQQQQQQQQQGPQGSSLRWQNFSERGPARRKSVTCMWVVHMHAMDLPPARPLRARAACLNFFKNRAFFRGTLLLGLQRASPECSQNALWWTLRGLSSGLS